MLSNTIITQEAYLGWYEIIRSFIWVGNDRSVLFMSENRSMNEQTMSFDTGELLRIVH